MVLVGYKKQNFDGGCDVELEAYISEDKVEKDHWWFTGRRWLFKKEIENLTLATTAQALEVGTSTGNNFRILREMSFASIQGLELNEGAIEFCRRKGIENVEKGDICNIPYSDNSFDFIMATDIIEHVDDDNLALSELYRVLRPSGYILLTVPTFQSLWGMQDDIAHHRRRYRMKQLLAIAQRAKFDVVRKYYFNFILFLPIFITRQFLRRWPPKDLESENDLNSPFINTVFKLIFKIDLYLAPLLAPPFGVSALLILKKEDQ